MKTNMIDLILHPVRLRILMALVGNELTPQQLNAKLPDVPQATLYRHVKRLEKGKVIKVVEEHPVRGAVEKVYALDKSMSNVSHEALKGLDKDKHMRIFVSFIISLLRDYSIYLDGQEEIDLAADGVGYRSVKLRLSDEELKQMATALNKAVAPFLYNKPNPQRRERIFSTILMPALDTGNLDPNIQQEQTR